MWPLALLVLDLLTYSDKKISGDPCFLQVQNGKVGCIGDNEVICEVSCDGEYQGRFHCSKDKGWKEKLPYCVKQTKDLSSIAICPGKEVYSECQGHCERSCSDWDKPAECSPNLCVGACVCGEGLVRGPGGKCVSTDSCPVSSNNAPRTRKVFFGCPDEEKCNEHCKSLGYLNELKGHCGGPNQSYCICL
ncbi:hypothetical protein AVEN_255869-1 [Araneus ventricosus]|uniref:TIL domain-containing protein n=1 Tax=Araneus ventricosus TaxID=182803 RepID=A0A4Y2DG25_ARAVE|nr:hypothetical protein AVEN_255869-1 [Araneus ventricosus]